MPEKSIVKNQRFDNLNAEEEQTLITILNLVIPPSEDDKMPGAADIGFIDYIQNQNLISWIREGLINIFLESEKEYGRKFLSLNDSEQTQLIEKFRRKVPKFYNRLTAEIIQCYYQNDDVLTAIGLEARPPFPKGYFLEEGDLTLLEPVFLRGKIYRDW